MGFVPSVEVAYLMSIVTMLCWGSWSAAMRKSGNWRFEAWYVDFMLAAVVVAFIWGITLGSSTGTGWHPGEFMDSLTSSTPTAISLALFAGAVGGIGNYILTAAIRLGGMALAFPIGVGLALALGTCFAYVTNPTATHHPAALFIGLIFVLVAILCNGLAHATKHAHIPSSKLKRGILLAVIGGILIALFPFPFNFSFEQGMNPYAGSFYLLVGALVTNLLFVPYFMRKPLIPGEPAVGISEYLRAKSAWRISAIVAGCIWATGNVFNLIVANQPKFSVAIAFTLGQCAAMVAAIWGIFLFKEFGGAPRNAYYYLTAMFAMFIVGILFIANAIG
jgi:glucose uptake protein